MAKITVEGLEKKFGSVPVLQGIDLSIEDGEFVVFVGPSGCGKSTLLRLIAGLEEPTAGVVTIGGEDVTDHDPSERGVAMVFQSYALYPHMSVSDNLSFGLRMAGTPRPEIERRVAEAARILELSSLLDRRPRQLSGGQRQRVAIGRAIVRQPGAFLFDEPLSNLDAELRVQMRIEIAKLHQDLTATMVYVTHDQVEAMTLADRIVVMRAGKVEQVGTPLELYRFPANEFVAGFIGSPRINLFSGIVAAENRVSFGGVEVPVGLSRPLPVGTQVTVGLRPEHMDSAEGTITLPIAAEVVEQLGSTAYVHGTIGTGEAIVAERRMTEVERGAVVPANIMLDQLLVFDGDGLRVSSAR